MWKKFLLIIFIVGVIFIGYHYISIYKQCVEVFKNDACIHGVRVDGQWFTSASSLASYLLFTKGLIFRESEFEYEAHQIKSL